MRIIFDHASLEAHTVLRVLLVYVAVALTLSGNGVRGKKFRRDFR